MNIEEKYERLKQNLADVLAGELVDEVEPEGHSGVRSFPIWPVNLLSPVISELNTYLNRGQIPLELVEVLRKFFDVPAKLFLIESKTTPGAGITVTFKPSDFLVDLLSALRAGNVEGVIVPAEEA